MNKTYAQTPSPVSKNFDFSAASVLDSSSQGESLQRHADLANGAAQCASLPPRPNNTGMPDDLKSGIESLSGFSMDDVRVHYNSSKPATVQALAYTQGTDIHVAPGQEKCLPHEAWHVAQQMAGRVSPTTNVNGMPVNDNAALEHEADVMGEKAVQCKNDLCTAFANNSFHPKTSNVKQFVVQRDEDGSVFDVGKILAFLTEKFGDKCKREDAERVQTLFEDIRQVDLQFLATTALAYAEDDPSYETTQKADQSTGSVESVDEKEESELENQNFKKMVEAKIVYLEQMKGKVKEAQTRLFCEFDLALGNRERFAVKKKLDNNDRYYSELCFQVDLLKKALNSTEMEPTGTLFNQNVLLTSGVDVDCYMSIVGPGYGSYKDIVQDESGLVASGKQLQIGIASPVRQFSWYLKYLIDDAATANNSPLIRTFKMPRKSFELWQENAISEKMRKKDDLNPMNEDFKVWNQFGLPLLSPLLKESWFVGSSLTTVVDKNVVPTDHPLLNKGGSVLSLDDFKEKIGFGRWKNGKFVPSDVHLLDKSHTAFFNIAGKKADLYTAKMLKTLYDDYSRLMLYMELKFGSAMYLEKMKKLGIEKNADDADSDKRIKDLIIFNNCIPSDYIDKDGLVESEREFGVESLLNTDTDNGRLIQITLGELNGISDKQITALEHNFGIMNELYELRKIDSIKDIVKNPLTVDCLKEILKYFDKTKNEKIRAVALCFKILRILEHTKKQISEGGENSCVDLSFVRDQVKTSNAKYLLDKQLLEKIKYKVDLQISLSKSSTESEIEKIRKKLSAVNSDIAAIRSALKLVLGEKIGIEIKANRFLLNAVEESVFANRTKGRFFDQLNPKVDVVGDNRIPYDKFASFHRYVPDGTGTVVSKPFIGGASGTTRDISKFLLGKNRFTNEKDYYKFHLLNASFMSTYGYHSFVEVFYRAAIEWLKFKADDAADDTAISKKIIEFVMSLPKDEGKKVDFKEYISRIIGK